MRARFATTLFCKCCNHAMEHVGSEYLRCIQPGCPNAGKKFEHPTVELVELVEPKADEAVAGDFGLSDVGSLDHAAQTIS